MILANWRTVARWERFTRYRKSSNLSHPIILDAGRTCASGSNLLKTEFLRSERFEDPLRYLVDALEHEAWYQEERELIREAPGFPYANDIDNSVTGGLHFGRQLPC